MPARIEFISRAATVLAESDAFGDRMLGGTKGFYLFSSSLWEERVLVIIGGTSLAATAVMPCFTLAMFSGVCAV